jgi:hypothetical protein
VNITSRRLSKGENDLRTSFSEKNKKYKKRKFFLFFAAVPCWIAPRATSPLVSGSCKKIKKGRPVYFSLLLPFQQQPNSNQQFHHPNSIQSTTRV